MIYLSSIIIRIDFARHTKNSLPFSIISLSNFIQKMLCYLLCLVIDEVYISRRNTSNSFFISLSLLHAPLSISYHSSFIIKKIVGANEGLFVEEIVAVVAEACESDFEQINHSTKVNGKWVSVTCHAPVQNAEMLYALYEKIDLDPRVKFKF